tara:strand:+ start:20657 stop:21016 length:360 start_codon:yes stop_codon:yes gene_type:complete
MINMDIKSIFILVLGTALVISFIFRPSKDISTYEDEINKLKDINKGLTLNNDSLLNNNGLLNIEINKLINNFDSTQVALANTEEKLKDLENDKGKVSGYVNTLNADGVANELANYLNRR